MHQEVEADHVQGVDRLKEDPILVPAVHVDLIHQRNQSLLPDHQRGENQPLQGVPDLVLVHVHRH